MLNNFFINRPRFAVVIALILMIAGIISFTKLPLEEYPMITPPQIVAMATYPGASAEVIESTVAAPLEAAVNGVEDMIYMSSESSEGVYSLRVFFEIGTDPDMALINVQNRLNLALPQLPEEVKRFGLYVKDQIDGPGLMIIGFNSPNNEYDQVYISNYASIYVKDALSRVKGVGEVEVFGARDYSMRVWLNPDKMANLGVSNTDIANAIASQNIQIPAGSIGQAPITNDQKLQLTIRTKGRLKDISEFENIVVKSDFNAASVKLKDVARVELGAQSYSTIGRVNGTPAALMKITQVSDANAIEVSKALRKKMEQLEEEFPEGIEYKIVRDETDFIQESMQEVGLTIALAILFVGLITYVFFGERRSSFITVITIPVSLIGTFIALYILGFSINTLTLFGLVLAIGIVVDDTIVVIENIQRHIQNGLSAKDAAIATMKEVSGAVFATTLVLLAVFIPVGFIPGLTGKLYVQFAVGISIAIVLSMMLALTLAPALGSNMLGKKKDPNKKPSKFTVLFESLFKVTTHYYLKAAKYFIERKALTVLVLAIMAGLTVMLYSSVPTGFLPDEDKAVIFSIVKMPEGASITRTDEVTRKIEQQLEKTEGIMRVISFCGFGGPNQAIVVSQLDDWDKRKRPDLKLGPMIGKLNGMFFGMPEAEVFSLSPPAIPGLGWFGGFQMEVQDKGDNTPQYLAQKSFELMMAAMQNPKIMRLFTTYQANLPQILVEIDTEKALAQGVMLNELYNTISGQFGSYYINDFNKLGRVFKVQMQADATYRQNPEDINRLYVKNVRGEMVPMNTMVKISNTVGPQTLSRFNMFRAATMNGAAAPGVSSGAALKEMQKIADQVLPKDFSFEWSGTAREEVESEGQAPLIIGLALIFVYLFLVAQYESWTIPLAVMLVSPVAAIGGMLALFITNMEFNLYSQIGMVMLIGLATKHAILIVEFAKQERETGTSINESALKAAGLRFRAVMMTVISFILGVMPLVFASGAGAAGRSSIGITVFGGMIAIATVGTLLVPAFYTIIQSMKENFSMKKHTAIIPLILLLLVTQPVKAETIEGTVEENIVLTITECVDKALENNPQIKAATSDTFILHSKIGQARSRYFPRAGFSTGTTRVQPDYYQYAGVSVNQRIYDFGKTSALLKASKLNHEAAQSSLQAMVNETVYNVKEAYYMLLFAQKKQEVMQETVNNFQEHLNQAEAFYKVGTRAKIDVTTAKFNLSDAKLNLIKAKNEVDLAYANLNAAMGLPKQRDYTIEEDLSYEKAAISFDDAIDMAYESRPDLKAAKLRTDASQRLVKFSKKAATPDIQGAASYSVGDNDYGDDNVFGFGINLELPITNGYLIKKQVDEAKAQLDKDLAMAEKLEQDVYVQTKQAFIKLNESEEKIPVTELLLQQASETHDLASGRYKAGLGDVIELKDAEIEHRNAQLLYFNSILEYNIALANLERVVGGGEL